MADGHNLGGYGDFARSLIDLFSGSTGNQMALAAEEKRRALGEAASQAQLGQLEASATPWIQRIFTGSKEQFPRGEGGTIQPYVKPEQQALRDVLQRGQEMS